MIMENYHQRDDDELYHDAKSELQQSNHYIDDLDTRSLMKTINKIYSVYFSKIYFIISSKFIGLAERKIQRKREEIQIILFPLIQL